MSNRWLYNRFGILEGYTSDDSPESKSKTGGGIVEPPVIYRPSKAKYEEALKKKPKGTSKERCKKKIGKKERRHAAKPLRGITSTAIRIHLPPVNLMRVAHNEGADHLTAPQRPPSPEPPSELQMSIRDLLLPGCIYGEVGQPPDQSFMITHQDVIGSSYFAAQVRHMHGMLNVKKAPKVVKGTPLSGRNPSGQRSVPQVEIKKPRPAVTRTAKNAKSCSLSPLPITTGIPEKKPQPVREKRKGGIAEHRASNHQEYTDLSPSSAREGNLTVHTMEAARPPHTNASAAVPVLKPQIDRLLKAKAVAFSSAQHPEGPPRKTERASDGSNEAVVTNALKQGKGAVEEFNLTTPGLILTTPFVTHKRGKKSAKVARDKNGPHIRPRSGEQKAKKKAATQSVVEAAVRRSPRHIR